MEFSKKEEESWQAFDWIRLSALQTP